jgi:hypothetical protein
MSLHLYNINYSFFWIKQKGQNKLKALVDMITEKTMKECKVKDMVWAMRDCMNMSCMLTLTEEKSRHNGMAFGIFLLTDGKQVLSSAMYQYGKIITRWTPPRHRGKGYAREILRRIQTHYGRYAEIPLWIVSEEKMWASNLKLGWQEGQTHTSPEDDHVERDFFPPEKKELYADEHLEDEENYRRYKEDYKRFVMDSMSDCLTVVDLNLKVKV